MKPPARPRPAHVDELESLVGVRLGPTAWRAVRQVDVDRFAELTGDHQWIHVDIVRASAGAFGGTVAHGLLTLSLGPALMQELIDLSAFPQSLNYGYDRIRFPAPVPVGERVRATGTIAALDPRASGAVLIRLTQRIEVEGNDRPACVANSLVLVGQLSAGAEASV